MKKLIFYTIILFLIPYNALKATTYDITVSTDGTGDYTTIQAALNAVTSNSSTRTVIYVKDGTYEECITLASTKINVTLIGQSVDGVVITYDNAANKTNASTGSTYGTGGSATFFVKASGFYAKNITFENSAGTSYGPALAINVTGDKAIFNNCKFLGRQDTYYGGACRQYLRNCYIEGTTDFIFGSTTAFFDRCTLYSYGGSALTAANTASYVTYGLVFNNCTVLGASGVSTLLGRTWGGYAATAFINCALSSIISSAGWSDWGNSANDATARYCEYGNTGSGASTSGRVSWCNILSGSEAANYTYLNVLKTTYSSSPTTDNWNPYDVIGNDTVNVLSGSTFSVIAKHSGKGLDVADASNSNGANIQQYNYVGGTNQKFIITQVDGDYYSIINVNSNKGLDVADGSTANYANIQQWTYNSQSNQQFKFVSTGDGYYKIVNRLSEKCLDVTDASTSNKANVQQYKCGSGSNQRWKLNFVSLNLISLNTSSMLLNSSNEINTTDTSLKNSFSIYPSPSTDGNFYIKLKSSATNQTIDVEIYDSMGKKLMELQTLSDNLIQTGLKSGVYIVVVKSEGDRYKSKLLIY